MKLPPGGGNGGITPPVGGKGGRAPGAPPRFVGGKGGRKGGAPAPKFAGGGGWKSAALSIIPAPIALYSLCGGIMGFINPAPNLILGAAIIVALPPLSCCCIIWSIIFCALSCPKPAK